MFQKIVLILLIAGLNVQADEFSEPHYLTEIKNNIVMSASETSNSEEPLPEDPLSGERSADTGPDSTTSEPTRSSGEGGFDYYPGAFKVKAVVNGKSRKRGHSANSPIPQTDFEGDPRADNGGPDSTEEPARGAGEPSGGYSLGGGFTTPDSPVFSEKVSVSLVEKAQSLIGSDIKLEDQIRNGAYAAFFSAYGLRLIVNFVKKKGLETSIKAVPRLLGAAVAIGGYVGSASASADLPGYTTAADSFINQSAETIVEWANSNEEFRDELLGILTYLDNQVCQEQELEISEEASAYCN